MKPNTRRGEGGKSGNTSQTLAILAQAGKDLANKADDFFREGSSDGAHQGTPLNIPKINAPLGQAGAQSGGGIGIGLNTANNWLGATGYAEGGIGAVQIGMLGYRQSLSISSKIGTFGSFSSTYRALGTTGKVLGRVGYVGAVTNTIVDYNSMQTGEIGGGRFAYRTAGTLGSIGGRLVLV